MSEQALRRFLERLNGDEAFRESLKQDPQAALAAFELSATEQAALAAGDEDALRRLSGIDVAAFRANAAGAAELTGAGICHSLTIGCSILCPRTDPSYCIDLPVSQSPR